MGSVQRSSYGENLQEWKTEENDSRGMELTERDDLREIPVYLSTTITDPEPGRASEYPFWTAWAGSFFRTGERIATGSHYSSNPLLQAAASGHGLRTSALQY